MAEALTHAPRMALHEYVAGNGHFWMRDAVDRLVTADRLDICTAFLDSYAAQRITRGRRSEELENRMDVTGTHKNPGAFRAVKERL